MNVKDFIKNKEIKLVSELYYICELGKYIHHYTGQALDISEVYFNEQLRTTQQWNYFKLALINGWLVSFHTVGINLYWEKMNQIANIFVWVSAPDKEPMQLSEIKNHTVIVKYEQTEQGLKIKPSLFNGRIRSELVYLSFIAHMVVKNTLADTHIKTIIDINAKECTDLGAFTMVYSLYETGVINDWVDLRIDKDVEQELKYRAWALDGFEKELTYKEHSNAEKLDHMKELDIAEKDVVFIYTQGSQKTNKPIVNCDLAIVKEITDTEITFVIVMNPRLRADIEQDYNNLNPKLRQMFSKKDLDNLNIIEKTFSLEDLGIGQMVNKEKYFIEPLGKTRDTVKTYMEKYLGNLINKDVEITQEEFIARLLRENNLDFNVQKFRNICIKNGSVVERSGRMDFKVIPQEIKDYCTTVRISETGNVTYDNLAQFRK